MCDCCGVVQPTACCGFTIERALLDLVRGAESGTHSVTDSITGTTYRVALDIEALDV